MVRNNYKFLSYFERKFLFLSLFIIGFVSLYPILLDYYGGDFFYHAAAINEFKNNLVSPFHPYYGIEGQSPHLTPYHFILGIISKLFHLNVIPFFQWVGIFNIILFLLSIYFFCKKYFDNTEIPFFAVFFIIFLWGIKPWAYSNFFHILVLGVLTPYHSTISISLAFFCFILVLKLVETGNWKYLIPIPFLIAFISLSQPINSVFVSAGTAVLIIFSDKIVTIIKLQYLTIISLLSFVLILSWPFYNFFDLIFQMAEVQKDLDTGNFYNLGFIVTKTFPLLLLMISLSFLFKDSFKNHKTLFYFASIILIIYLLGAPFNINYIGRLISPFIILMQIILALYFIKLRIKNIKLFRVLMTLVLILSVYQLSYSFSKLLEYKQNFKLPQTQLISVLEKVQHNDVIITDLETSYIIPAIKGKVVAQIMGEAFVHDNIQRKKDLAVFYDMKVTNDTRKNIIEKYRASYILLNKSEMKSVFSLDVPKLTPLFQETISELGSVIDENDSFVLIQVKN